MPKVKTIKVIEPPKVPTLNFSRKTGSFVKKQGTIHSTFVPQATRITQHKGGTSGGGSNG